MLKSLSQSIKSNWKHKYNVTWAEFRGIIQLASRIGLVAKNKGADHGVWTRYPESVPFTGKSVEAWPNS